jgi:multiple sugar transport system substrate-binding protein
VLAGAAAPAAGILAACGAPSAGTDAGGKSARPATLAWSIWSSPAILEAQAEGARLFQQKYPHVTIQTSGYKEQKENITAWLGGGGPDVAMGFAPDMTDTGRQGMYAPLDPLIKRDARAVPLQDYVEAQLGAHQAPGAGRFALPMFLPVYALMYHKPTFQKKGLPLPDDTWDWTRYADQLLKVADPAQGVWGGLIVRQRFGATHIHQNGGDVVDPKDDRKAAFAGPAGIEALQWIHDRLWKDRTWGQANDRQAGGFKDAKAMLAGGKVATWEEGVSWELGDMLKEHPGAVADWDFAVLPRARQRASRTAIDAWVIWKGTKEPDVSWEFMKFLQTTDWFDVQARLAGYQHPRVSQQDHYLDVVKKRWPELAPKNLQAFTHPVKNRYARPDAIFRKDGEAWTIFTEAWNAAMVRNEQSVAAAFQDAARRVDAAMAT